MEKSGWQLIETAPDGREILVWRDGMGVVLARFIALKDFITTDEAEDFANQDISESFLEEKDWFYADFRRGDRLSPDCYPTHWMPLPQPPSIGETMSDADG